MNPRIAQQSVLHNPRLAQQNILRNPRIVQQNPEYSVFQALAIISPLWFTISMHDGHTYKIK